MMSYKEAIWELHKDIVKIRSDLRDLKKNANINSIQIEKLKKKVDNIIPKK